MEKIFANLKVIDVASFIAGPAAATIMADFGAAVIKIEPLAGDGYRTGLNGPGYPISDYPHHWNVDNRTKRGLALDLKSEQGREIFNRLVKEADVLITNMPSGPRERLGMRYEDVRGLNERLIYASISAYGESGAESARTGFDSTAFWARSGLMDQIKPSKDSPPARSLPGMGDHPTATALFGAIMVGLYKRQLTGEGSMVSTSLMANGLWSNAVLTQAALSGGQMRSHPPREEAGNALNNLYRSRDGRWFHLIMITGEHLWGRFAEVTGRTELLTDPRFESPEARNRNAPALIRILDAIFLERDAAQWRELLTHNGFNFGETHQVEDVVNDQQMRDSGALAPMADDRAGCEWIVDSPIWVEGVEKSAPTLAPGIGEHTDEILRAAGYNDTEIASFRTLKVVG
jgi:crotonobetainyl-CoA:carnitine CoA-transferase CaiB-like acyl-CoA transferase